VEGEQAPTPLSHTHAAHATRAQMPGASASLLQELLAKLQAPQGGKQGQGGQEVQQGSLLRARTTGSLGPLGEFLLGQWQEEVVQEVEAARVRGVRG